jgi:O-acetyl-ADP-ribose deacetylase (regulator of RNase III)
VKLTAIKGDITILHFDAIVNAANTELTTGGGVCGAIHRAAGPALAEECAAIGMCLTGHAVVTHGYRLPAPWVIHAVGPIWHGGEQDEAKLLADCYAGALRLAESKRLRSIAFPCISTGIYGFPPDLACRIAVVTVRAHKADSVQEVRFCCFGDPDLHRYTKEIACA